jgi:hypothetical protein
MGWFATWLGWQTAGRQNQSQVHMRVDESRSHDPPPDVDDLDD